MKQLKEGWANNNSVRIHFLDTGAEASPLTPILMVPGAFGSAEMYTSEFEAFAPRRCLSLSLRGRGKSDAPLKGYSLADQVGDLSAVITHTNLTNIILMAFSMGTPVALQYALTTNINIAGIIVVDYPARYPNIPEEWAVKVKEYLPAEKAKPHVVDGIQRDSEEILLWEQLSQIQCPLLVMHGKQEGTLLPRDVADTYQAHAPHAQLVEFPESGHALWEPSYEQFIEVVKEFLEEIDKT